MDPKEPFVITISREIGSGGHTIGQILADRLNTPYYDKDIIRALETKFNLTAAEIEKLKGEKKKWLADFVQFVNPVPSHRVLDINSAYAREFNVDVTSADIYRAESEILKELAAEGSCVIAGRSGFHVLRNHPNHLHVFIYASYGNRIRRVMTKQRLNEESAIELIREIDRARENYIQRFAFVNRYDAHNYDLVINADGHTEEQIADLIISYIG